MNVLGLNNFGRNLETEVCPTFFQIGEVGSQKAEVLSRVGPEIEDITMRISKASSWRWEYRRCGEKSSSSAQSIFGLLVWFLLICQKKRFCGGAPNCWACIFYGIASVSSVSFGPVFASLGCQEMTRPLLRALMQRPAEVPLELYYRTFWMP